MTPTQFEFIVTLPGDTRLVGVVKQLAAQAAGYANLVAGAADALAAHVERATEAALTAMRDGHNAITVRFTGDEHAIDVVLSYDAAGPARLPATSSTAGTTVEWRAAGARHECHIRQPVAA